MLIIRHTLSGGQGVLSLFCIYANVAQPPGRCLEQILAERAPYKDRRGVRGLYGGGP